MSKKNKNKKSKFGLFAALAAIAGVGIYFFTKDSEKENVTSQKPEWWYFAHPQRKYETITNDEIEELFEKIFIPETGYTTCDGTQYVNAENPGTVKSIIYIPTGEVITDIDNSFFSKLITYHDSINYGFKNINGNSIYGITELTKEAEAKTATDLAKEAAEEAAEEAASSPSLEIVPDYDEEEALAILTTSNSADNLRSNDVYLNILKYYSIPYFREIYPNWWDELKLDPNRFDEIPYNRNGIEVPYIVDNKTLTLIPKEHFNSDFFNTFYNNIYNYDHGKLNDIVKITLADGRKGYVYTVNKKYNKSPYFQAVIAKEAAEAAAEKAKAEAAKTEEQKAKEAAEKAEEERQLIEAFKTAFEKNIIL